MLTVAELCAGYGGLALATGAVWPVELTWYAEVDADASAVMAAHHPGVPNVGDITQCQFSAQEPVDVLAAGWPCTPVSGAGRQRGAEDERWLWPDVARAVRMLQPQTFVGENVPRLLTIDQGLLFGSVLADLDTFGYTVRWTTVGACRVGLAHHRHRIFLAATRDVVELDRWPSARLVDGRWQTAADTLFGDGGMPRWPAAGVMSGGLVWEFPAETCGVTSGVALLPTPTAAPYGNNQSPSPGAAVRPSLEGVAQMLPTPGARLGDGRGDPSPNLAADRIAAGRRNLDDAIASLLPTPTARDGMSGPGHADSAEGSPDLRTAVATLLPTPRARDSKGRDPNPRGADLNEAIAQLLPTPRASDGRHGGPGQLGSSGDLALPSAVQPGRFGPYEAAVRRHELVTGVPAPEPTEPGRDGQPRLSPRFVEWLMAVPTSRVTGHVGRSAELRRSRWSTCCGGQCQVGRSAQLRLLGNGVVPRQAAYALSLLLPERMGVPAWL